MGCVRVGGGEYGINEKTRVETGMPMQKALLIQREALGTCAVLVMFYHYPVLLVGIYKVTISAAVKGNEIPDPG